MPRWTLLILFLSIVMVTPFAGARGQSLQPPKYLAVLEETIDPSLTDQYEQGVALTVAAMRKAKLGAEWNWATSQHNHTYSYVFAVQTLEEVSTMRAQQQLRRFIEAIGEDGKRAGQLATPALRGNRLIVLEYLEELSYRPSTAVIKSPRFVHVDLVRARADMIEQHKSVIKRVATAMLKAGNPIPFSCYRVVIGDGGTIYGEGRTFYYVAPFDNMSQFYDQYSYHAAMDKALGKDEAKQTEADLLKGLEAFEIYDSRLRPDLSYHAEKKE